MHDDEMDRFIQEQKHRLDNERKLLENNPPSAVTDYILQDVDHSNNKISNRSVQDIAPSPQVCQVIFSYWYVYLFL